MNTVAIDTTQHADVGVDAVVGGLTLYERSTRMAARAGADHVVVLADQPLPSIENPRVTIELVEEVAAEIPQIRSDVLYALNDGELEPLITITTNADRHHAEDLLWDGCRKAVDGIISRHLNRHLSLAVSRRIAHTRVMPNHVTGVTFSLGVLSAVFAAVGGSIAWAIAGVLFQATSVLDGVDGELARVRMDGSVMGEWLDTISDDSSDVLMYGALGIGAWRMLYAAPEIPPILWLLLGLGAALGKLVSMAVYYRWLRARGRGDLLAFEWSFDDPESQSALQRVLANLKYVTKNDFIAFTVMVLGLFGVLPWFLFAAFIGTWVVAFAAFRESAG